MIPRQPVGTVRRVPKGTVKSVQQLALEKLEEKINAVSVIQGPAGPAGSDGKSAEFKAEDYLFIAELLKKDPDFKDSVKGEKGEKGADAPKFAGGGGSAPTVKYIPIRAATYTLKATQTIAGTNVLGVDFDGDVTITIPDNLRSDRILVVNDESGNAGANNITVQTN